MMGYNTVLSWLDDLIKKRALLHVKHQQQIIEGEDPPWNSDEEEEELKDHEEVVWSLLSNSIFLAGALMSSTVALYSVWEDYNLDEGEEENEIKEESWIYKFLYVGGPFLYFIEGLVWNYLSSDKTGVTLGVNVDYSVLEKNGYQMMKYYVNNNFLSPGHNSSSLSDETFSQNNTNIGLTYRTIRCETSSSRSDTEEEPRRNIGSTKKIKHSYDLTNFSSVKLSTPILYTVAAALESLECLLDCFITAETENIVQASAITSNSYNATTGIVGDFHVTGDKTKIKDFFIIIIWLLDFLSNHGYLLVSILDLHLIDKGKYYFTQISRSHSAHCCSPNIGDKLLFVGDALFFGGCLLDVVVCNLRLQDYTIVSAISPLLWTTDATIYIVVSYWDYYDDIDFKKRKPGGEKPVWSCSTVPIYNKGNF